MADAAELAKQIESEKIRLIEADLAQTNEFVKGVLTTGAALRGSAITIWLALLGFAAQQSMPALALLAAVVAAVFWLADGYHGWLYGEAFAHAQRIERLLSQYYDNLSRAPDSEHSRTRFAAKLRAHRYGLYNGFSNSFNLAQLWRSARPRLFYRWLYPSLFAIAILLGAAGMLGISLKSGTPNPTRVIVEQAPAVGPAAPSIGPPTPSPTATNHSGTPTAGP